MESEATFHREKLAATLPSQPFCNTGLPTEVSVGVRFFGCWLFLCALFFILIFYSFYDEHASGTLGLLLGWSVRTSSEPTTWSPRIEGSEQVIPSLGVNLATPLNQSPVPLPLGHKEGLLKIYEWGKKEKREDGQFELMVKSWKYFFVLFEGDFSFYYKNNSGVVIVMYRCVSIFVLQTLFILLLYSSKVNFYCLFLCRDSFEMVIDAFLRILVPSF